MMYTVPHALIDGYRLYAPIEMNGVLRADLRPYNLFI
jgi:hypothetical protein